MTWAPDPYLIGNGAWCSCCFPDGPPKPWRTPPFDGDWRSDIRKGCNECAGTGRVAYSAEAIVETAVAEKRAVRGREARRAA